MAHLYSLSAESKAIFPAEIAATLKTDLGQSKDREVEANAKKLLDFARCQPWLTRDLRTLEFNPFRVVEHIIDTMQHKNFATAQLSTQYLLAETLQEYIDLTVLYSLQDETYRVLQRTKEDDFKKLLAIFDDLIRLQGHTKTIPLQYALSCAQAGLRALRDTETHKSEAIRIGKMLGQVASQIANVELGDAFFSCVTAIKQLWQELQQPWYPLVLEIRLLTPLLTITQLQQWFNNPEIRDSTQWQVWYTVQAALHVKVAESIDYLTQIKGFSGQDSEETPDPVLLPSVQKYFQRAATPSYEDDVKLRYRVFLAVLHLSQHSTPWIQQEARLLLQKAETYEQNRTLLALCRTQTYVLLPPPVVLPNIFPYHSFTLVQHLDYYRQLPVNFRVAYRKMVTETVTTPNAPDLLTALARYPQAGQRPLEPRLVMAQQWDEVLRTQLTVEAKRVESQAPCLSWYNFEDKLEERVVAPAICAQLLDEQNNLRDSRLKESKSGDKLPGQRLVIPIRDKDNRIIAYAKLFPQMPALQVLTSIWEDQVTGCRLQFSVAKLTVGDKVYPLLISQPAGMDLQSVAQADEKQKQVPLAALQEQLDPRHFTFVVLFSVLARFEDHQAANLATQLFYSALDVQSYRLVGIDTDHVLQEALTESEDLLGSIFGEQVLNHKNIIYCFAQMLQSLDLQAVREFLKLDPATVIKIIFEAMTQYEQQMLTLFTRQELLKFFKAQAPGQIPKRDNCLLVSELKPGTLTGLYLRFHALQLVLQKGLQRQRLPTPLRLLQQFEREAAVPYVRILKQPDLSPWQRFTTVLDLKMDAKALTPTTTLPSQWVRPSQLQVDKMVSQVVTHPLAAHRTAEEYLLKFSLQDKERRWRLELSRVYANYGGCLDHHYEVIVRVKEALEAGQLAPFLELSRYPALGFLIERILKLTRFDRMHDHVKPKEKVVQLQTQLLETLSKLTLYDLHLHYCEALTDTKLEALCKKNKKTLRTVDVRGCAALTDRAVQVVAEHCAQLEKLNICAIPQIRNIGRVNFRGKEDGPLIFSVLESFQFDDFPRLERFDFRAPQLKTLWSKRYEDYKLIKLVEAVAQGRIGRLNGRQKQTKDDRSSMFFWKISLHNAVEENNLIAVRCFLELGSYKINEKCDFSYPKKKENRFFYSDDEESGNYTPLMGAARRGYQEIAKCLVEAKAAIDEKNDKGDTAFSNAVDAGHSQIAMWLLEVGASVLDAKIIRKAAETGCAEVVNYILQGKANVKISKEDVEKSLRNAAANGHQAIVRRLLTYGVPVDARNFWEETALIRAVNGGHMKVVNCLVEAKADVNVEINMLGDESAGWWHARKYERGEFGSTALMNAVFKNNLDMVKCLVELKADVNKKDVGRNVDEFYEFEQFHPRIDVKVDEPETYEDWTVLMMAVSMGSRSIIEYLLEAKGEVNKKAGKNKMTALMMAASMGYHSVAECLLEAKASVNEKDEVYGRTALLWFASSDCQKGGEEMIDRLLQVGAKWDERDKENKTAVQLAKEYGGLKSAIFELREAELQAAAERDQKKNVEEAFAAAGRPTVAFSPALSAPAREVVLHDAEAEKRRLQQKGKPQRCLQM